MRQKFPLLGLLLSATAGVIILSCSAFSIGGIGKGGLHAEEATRSLNLPFLAASTAIPTATNQQGTIPNPSTRTQVATLAPSVTGTTTPVATTPTASASPVVTSDATPTQAPNTTLTATPTPTTAQTPTPIPTKPLSQAREDFEEDAATWLVSAERAGSAEIIRSDAQKISGNYSAQLHTAAPGSVAQIGEIFSEPSDSHTWGERPGTWVWQRAYVYLPSSTVQSLGPSDYFDLAGLWDAGNDNGWWLRVRTDGALFIHNVDSNVDSNPSPTDFSIYAQFPMDRWVEVEIGLHSQAGPGVQRAFAVLIDGNFYGWYHQSLLPNTNYNRAAIGILATNSPASLELYVDHWYALTHAPLPEGTDSRSTAALQEQDYRTQSGVQWQIDWSTWRNNLVLDPQAGIYSATDRLQSGRNLDRMPDLTEGWAEIEIDWPQGTPPLNPDGYFGPMVGFRKEINREENLEIIPIGAGNGQVNLALEAWIGTPVILAQWPLPLASIGGGSHIPEPGDILRVRWEQSTATHIRVQASYYDASTMTWHLNVINHEFHGATIGDSQFGPVDYNDGYHTASSITIDTPAYSIRRFRVGTLSTYPPDTQRSN